MTKDQDHQFVEHVFGASLSLMAILVAVVGILVPLYNDAILNNPKLVSPFFWLTWGGVTGVVLAAGSAGLSLGYLRNWWPVRLGALVTILVALIASAAVGSLAFVWTTVN